ncbi:MAG: ectonucleotide pyrophosphatase/phosphodiesterase [Pseudomonadota bacterium]
MIRFSPGRLALVALLWLLASCASLKSSSPVTTILISIDGTHPKHLARLSSGTIRGLIDAGVQAEALLPVFPTKTFPNHYSQVTGLYPSGHGIVGNRMYDTVTNKRFDIADRVAKQDSSWWWGEPIWVTAAKQNVKVATMFWPGSEAEIQGYTPFFWRPFDYQFKSAQRVDQVLQWLDQEPDLRLVTLYFEESDVAGHLHGPTSPEFFQALQRIDGHLGALLSGLEERNRLSRTNIVIVSDHGMADTSAKRIVCLDDFVDAESQWAGKSPVLMLWPKDEETVTKLRQAHPHVKVYGEAEFPAHWRLTDNQRVAPYVVVADEGWTMYNACKIGVPKINPGDHGYDNALLSMRGLFVASGPSFKNKVNIPAVNAVDIYELLCHLLSIKPAKNDGSLSAFSKALRDLDAAEAP